MLREGADAPRLTELNFQQGTVSRGPKRSSKLIPVWLFASPTNRFTPDMLNIHPVALRHDKILLLLRDTLSLITNSVVLR
jgi:hypothetical protein